MKIDKMLENITVRRLIGYESKDVIGISIDDRDDLKGKVFVCLKGERSDGHDHAIHAVEKGAAVVVAEKVIDVNVPLILVDDTRKALALLCGIQ